jgi:hypothetical protein
VILNKSYNYLWLYLTLQSYSEEQQKVHTRKQYADIHYHFNYIVLMQNIKFIVKVKVIKYNLFIFAWSLYHIASFSWHNEFEEL